MDNKCLICQEEVNERAHFWKKHRIKEADYYQKYYPKKDLFTNELIPFKSPETYFISDFINKINLKNYLEKITKEEGLNYLKNWLIKRKEVKKLTYSPSNFELRTLCYPSIKFFHKFYGINSYEDICKEIGLINRYNYNNKINYIDLEPTILIDTRESNPLKFNNDKEIIKLDYGDYTAKYNPYNIFIERKSLMDFLSSISGGFERLSKEMERAKNKNANIIILIESKISNLFGFKHLSYLHTEASADYILKRARDLLLKYPHVQICCVDGRDKASELINKIFKLNIDSSKLDIQYLIDIGQL